MLSRFLLVCALCAASFAAACNADDGTGSNGALAVEAAISDATIGSGESATITFRLRNDSQRPRILVDHWCPPGLLIDDAQGTNVFPGNTGWICSLATSVAIVPDTVSPGEEVTRTFTVGGEAARGPLVRLPAGRYTAGARFIVGSFIGRYYDLRSPAVSFEVEP